MIVWLSLLAGALALDETAALQVMLSQPLVAGASAGLLAGDLPMGLAVGATLQLVWSGVLPVGAAPFPDGAVGSVAGVGTGVLLSHAGFAPGVSLASAVIAGLAAGVLGQRMIAVVRRLNVRHADMAATRGKLGDSGGVGTAVALGVATRFVAGALTTAVLLAGAIAIAAVAGPGTAGVPAQAGTFPTLLWAAPIACAAVAASTRGISERLLILAGFAAGLGMVSWL
jgi:mannose/fructose/N-acetylgalactosamine-specific phosphotransferase system component IIC